MFSSADRRLLWLGNDSSEQRSTVSALGFRPKPVTQDMVRCFTLLGVWHKGFHVYLWMATMTTALSIRLKLCLSLNELTLY